MTAASQSAGSDQQLTALEQRVRDDLSSLNHPVANWVPARPGPDGAPMLDVLVAGGGMCGQTAAFALLREGVSNLRVIDRAPAGLEGPWGTFARMQTLRSPKHLTSPDLGVPSLTYRSWHTALYGQAHWDSLHKIARLDWLRYLLWVRRMAALPIENRVELLELEPLGDAVRARLATPAGEQQVFARQVVLALGREGSGAPRWPSFPSFEPPAGATRGHVFHSADDIDFERLRGKRVALLGAGSSAFDNAGTALETGAAQVTMFARRQQLPQVNKSKWTAFPGFMHGFAELDDARRWQVYTYIFDQQVPPPWESVLRCDRHANFSLQLGVPWLDLQPTGQGVRVSTPTGWQEYDAAIIATGFDVDLIRRPEFERFHDRVLLWRDRVDATRAKANPEAARFPYLGAGFELQVADGDTGPTLSPLRLFNWGSTVSHGAVSGDIPGLATGAQRLARSIASSLFRADVDIHWQTLQALNEEELLPTRYHVPLAQRR